MGIDTKPSIESIHKSNYSADPALIMTMGEGIDAMLLLALDKPAPVRKLRYTNRMHRGLRHSILQTKAQAAAVTQALLRRRRKEVQGLQSQDQEEMDEGKEMGHQEEGMVLVAEQVAMIESHLRILHQT